jgi:hypothetical protein
VIKMAKMATKMLVVTTLLSFAALPALGGDKHNENDKHPGQNYRSGHDVSAPEIDPAQALGALTLLGGAVAIIRGYRRKK